MSPLLQVAPLDNKHQIARESLIALFKTVTEIIKYIKAVFFFKNNDMLLAGVTAWPETGFTLQNESCENLCR